MIPSMGGGFKRLPIGRSGRRRSRPDPKTLVALNPLLVELGRLSVETTLRLVDEAQTSPGPGPNLINRANKLVKLAPKLANQSVWTNRLHIRSNSAGMGSKPARTWSNLLQMRSGQGLRSDCQPPTYVS